MLRQHCDTACQIPTYAPVYSALLCEDVSKTSVTLVLLCTWHFLGRGMEGEDYCDD
jgi:hypothetical protein